MWLIFPLGLPYTLWRMGSKQRACPDCGEKEYLVSSDSALGKVIISNMIGEELKGAKREEGPQLSPVDIPRLADDEPKGNAPINSEPVVEETTTAELSVSQEKPELLKKAYQDKDIW